VSESLVVIVNGDGLDFLGHVLADDVLIEELADFAGTGDLAEHAARARDLPALLRDDVVTQVDTRGTDIDITRSFDEWSRIALALAAEAAGILLLTPTTAGPTGRG
jgi:hypothetical protein